MTNFYANDRLLIRYDLLISGERQIQLTFRFNASDQMSRKISPRSSTESETPGLQIQYSPYRPSIEHTT